MVRTGSTPPALQLESDNRHPPTTLPTSSPSPLPSASPSASPSVSPSQSPSATIRVYTLLSALLSSLQSPSSSSSQPQPQPNTHPQPYIRTHPLPQLGIPQSQPYPLSPQRLIAIPPEITPYEYESLHEYLYQPQRAQDDDYIYAMLWKKRMHVGSRYVAYYARSYYLLALASNALFIASCIAGGITIQAEIKQHGVVFRQPEVLYCYILALISLPVTGCIIFLTQRSNKPDLIHWTTRTDFHMLSALALAGCSLLLYTLTIFPTGGPLSVPCSDPETDWMCLISGFSQASGMLMSGTLLLATLTAYFNSVRLINALPLEIIQDPDSPAFWRRVNVADVDWEEERFIMI